MIEAIIFLALFTNKALATCNECTIFNVKCVSNSEYQYCITSTGAPIGEPFSCPSGQICSTFLSNQSIPCAESIPGILPDCTCGLCNDYGYACVSDTQLQLCFDGQTPSSPVIDCPLGSKCDSTSSSGSFCGKESESLCVNVTLQISTTTAITSTTTTMPAATTATASVCTGPGKYPTAGTNCRSYIVCVFNLITWVPVTFNCTGNALYNPSTQKCSLLYQCTE